MLEREELEIFEPDVDLIPAGEEETKR